MLIVSVRHRKMVCSPFMYLLHLVAATAVVYTDPIVVHTRKGKIILVSLFPSQIGKHFISAPAPQSSTPLLGPFTVPRRPAFVRAS